MQYSPKYPKSQTWPQRNPLKSTLGPVTYLTDPKTTYHSNTDFSLGLYKNNMNTCHLSIHCTMSNNNNNIKALLMEEFGGVNTI